MTRYRMLEPCPSIQFSSPEQLVDIESTTYHEGPAGAFLHEYLEGQRYEVERMAVSTARPHPDPRRRGRRALQRLRRTPRRNTRRRPLDPHGYRSAVLRLHARTTSFSTGADPATQRASSPRRSQPPIACARPVSKVGLLFVVGEERDSAGAAVANANPRGSKFLINGEPTDNRLALASKGALRVELRAKGSMAHSAYPELGESAIDKLIDALHDVLAMPLPVEPEIGPSTLNIGLIEGGRAPNVIADKAEAHILIRLVGPADEIKAATS